MSASPPPSSTGAPSSDAPPLPRPRTPPATVAGPPPDADGTLIKYGPAAAHTAFLYGQGAAHGRHVVFLGACVGGEREAGGQKGGPRHRGTQCARLTSQPSRFPGGLTDGFFATPYLPALASALARGGWSLVSALLRSSHSAWGCSSLDDDADDVDTLLKHLGARGSAGAVLMGHSTGCQISVRTAFRLHEAAALGGADDESAARAPLLGAVLQAPVSDREWFAHDPHTARRLAAAASAVCADLEKSIVWWSEWDRAPVTALRTLALAAKGGDDDMFSSDLTDSELRRAMAPLAGLPVLVVASGADEYVPRSVDIDALAHRIAGAIVPRGGGTAVVLEGAGHNCAGREDEVVEAVVEFVARRCAPKA